MVKEYTCQFTKIAILVENVALQNLTDKNNQLNPSIIKISFHLKSIPYFYNLENLNILKSYVEDRVWKLGVRDVIVFLRNVKKAKPHMIVQIVHGNNAIAGKKITVRYFQNMKDT